MPGKTFWDYAFMCHKRADRSFFYKGKQFPICARCTGLLVGYILSVPLLIMLGVLDLKIIMLLLLPMIIDGGVQHRFKKESTNFRRFVTGLLGGVGIMNIIFAYIALNHYWAEKLINFLSNK